ncbi:MAG: 50S ribosomal protein L10 [Pseudomonadales bacterium]|nr:50S ribosomal protein L10 [Pseudomonadales bacterium]
MGLRLEDKQTIVSEVNEAAGSALSAVLADYRGLTVAEMTELRSKARTSGIYLRVVRNTLAKRAIDGTPYECLRDALTGPTLVAFSYSEPGAAARLLRDYGKDREALNVKAISIGGDLFDSGQLDRIASLPNRDEAITMVLGLLLAPITKLARTVNEVPGRVVRTLAAVGEQKKAAM